MPAFFLYFQDDPAVPVDEALRARHREYFLGRGEGAILGGPLFDEQQEVAGRVLVADFPTLEAARAWGEKEPLVEVGRSRLVHAAAMAIVQKDGAFTPVGR